MNRRWLPVITLVLALGVPALLSTQASSYTRYSGDNNCVQCHSGFDGGFGNPLHDLHLEMTSDCAKCHATIGDNPELDMCAGCHVGEGLRLHHANADAPADAFGLLCVACHPGDAAPPPEFTLPPYYGMANVNLNMPCETEPTAGGEDYDGDGHGLDNDGDLLYEGNDPDCSVPVEAATWGGIKTLYN